MRKLKIIEHISLDGVIQTNSGPGDSFPYGDWTATYRSPAGLQAINEMYGTTCDVLLGRHTYDLLGSYWPTAPKSIMADRLNTSMKYVVTHRPDTLTWGPSQGIGPDVVEGIRRMKAGNGPHIIVAGSGSLIATLLEHGLADELVLLVNPIALGKGKRFFEGGGLPRSFALASSRSMPSGIVVNTYKVIPTLAEEAVSAAKLDREMEIARGVQERLFPQTLPDMPGIDMAACCKPAYAVGGDYYDLITINDTAPAVAKPLGFDRLAIAIGDISGKGMSAALLMASLHASLRGQVLSGSGSLGAKMANINRLLFEASETNRYATFFYAELDCHSRVLHYVNGGHNPPVVLRKQNDQWHVFRLEGGGPVIGLLVGAAYTQESIQLLPGDILLAFTDGISEAMNAADQEWGEERMIAEAQRLADVSATQRMQGLFRAAEAFVAGAPQHDDMTLVVLQLSS